MSDISYLILGLFLALGLVFFVLDRRRLQGCTRTAQGTVVGIEVSYKVNRHGKSESLSRPVVRYTVAEKTFKSRAEDFTDEQGLSISDTVEIRYDPFNPGTIVVGSNSGFFIASICSFSLGLLWVLLLIIA